MIYYHQWLSQDAKLNAIQSRRNEANAASFYESLKPLRTAVQWIGSLIDRQAQSRRTRIRWKAGLRELRALDERLLKDIGLTSGQIAEFARHPIGSEMEHRIALRGGRPLLGLASGIQHEVCEVVPLAPMRQARDRQRRSDEKRQRRSSLDAA